MTGDVAEVKEALEQIGPLIEGGYGVMVSEDSPLLDAARRWVRMVEGLDYEAAVKAYEGAWAQWWDEGRGLTREDPREATLRVVGAAVDAAVGVEKEIGDE